MLTMKEIESISDHVDDLACEGVICVLNSYAEMIDKFTKIYESGVQDNGDYHEFELCVELIVHTECLLMGKGWFYRLFRRPRLVRMLRNERLYVKELMPKVICSMFLESFPPE